MRLIRPREEEAAPGTALQTIVQRAVMQVGKARLNCPGKTRYPKTIEIIATPIITRHIRSHQLCRHRGYVRCMVDMVVL